MRQLTFTNELGQEVVLNYDAEMKSAMGPDELVEEAVKYKGKSILVIMKTGAVDPDFDSNEFFGWVSDHKNITGSPRETAIGRRKRRIVASISNKRLAGRVAKKRRDNANHAISPI